MNRQLAALPPGVRSLTNPETVRLRQQYPNLWADPAKSCITCTFETTGTKTFYARPTPRAAPDLYDCNCLDQWKLHRWMLSAGIGTRYQRLSWEDAAGTHSAAQEAVLEYTSNISALMSKGNGLTLWSPNRGTGKTLLAALAFKHVLAQGADGYFTQFNEMLDSFTAGWRNEEERSWFIRRVRNAGFLVNDDMGREHQGRSAVAEAMFDTVIRARVASAAPSFVTTNYTPAEMHQGYGSNVLSLLSEVNVEIEVPGVDFRPTMAAQDAQDARDGVVRPLVVG